MSRAQAVLAEAEKGFNLQTLVTEANLVRVGILDDKVGTICKFKRFKNGKAITSDSESENDSNDESDTEKGN